MKEKTRYIQVSNIALQTTRDQMVKLFGFIGKVEEIYLYPTVRSVGNPITSRICYIKFKESESVKVALQLTNQVFIDRALLVLPYHKSKIPDETEAINMLMNSSGIPGLDEGPAWPEHVKNEVDGVVLRTEDPTLKEHNLPPYPNLPATTDSCKVNEIRRTLVFDNLHPDVSTDDILKFAQAAGEIKYLRMGVEKDGTKNCLIEYAQQEFIIEGLKLHDQILHGLPLIVNHSTVAISKFQHKTKEASQKEIELELEKVNTANAMLTPGLNPLDVFDASLKISTSPLRSRSRSIHSRDKSRSRTTDRKRSRSRSSDRRRRSSKSHHRSVTPKRRRTRSKSRDSKREKSSKELKKKESGDEAEKSRSGSRSGTHHSSSKSRSKRSRSRSRHRSRRNRSRSRSKTRRNRKRTPERRKKSLSTSRSRSRTPKKKNRSRSRDRSRHSKSSRSERRSRDRSRDRKHKRRSSRSKDRSRSRDRKRKHKSSRSPSVDRRRSRKSEKSSAKDKPETKASEAPKRKSPEKPTKESEVQEMSVDMDLCDSS